MAPDKPDELGDVEPKTRKKLDDATYMKELGKLQIELVKLQEFIKAKGLKLVTIFEGRDAAGKGGTIKRVTETLNPRAVRVVALGVPTEREKSEWYFQRYVPHLPAAGEWVIFDRSWYNRAGVERVMGFCTEDEVNEFFRSCPPFEEMLIRSGIILVKYWFSVSDEEQERRFKDRIQDPTKRWKISEMDLESWNKWVEYSRAKDEMFHYTDTKRSPWYVVNSDDKKRARLNVISPPADRDPLRGPHAQALQAAAAPRGQGLHAPALRKPDLRARDLLTRETRASKREVGIGARRRPAPPDGDGSAPLFLVHAVVVPGELLLAFFLAVRLEVGVVQGALLAALAAAVLPLFLRELVA